MNEYEAAKRDAWMEESPSPDSPIESAFGELAKEVRALEECFSLLRSRTASISVAPPPPLPCADSKSAPAEPHSETWHTIKGACLRISAISDAIRELTNRLES